MICERFGRGRRGRGSRWGRNRLEGGLRKVGEEEEERREVMGDEWFGWRSANHTLRYLPVSTDLSICVLPERVFSVPPPRFAGELDGHLRWRPRHADGVEHLRLVDGFR